MLAGIITVITVITFYALPTFIIDSIFLDEKQALQMTPASTSRQAVQSSHVYSPNILTTSWALDVFAQPHERQRARNIIGDGASGIC